MTNLSAKSTAFREALLKSERLRIRLVLAAIGLAFSPRAMRAATVGGRENLMSLYMMGSLLALMAAYEFAMLRKIERAIRAGRDFRNWVWFVNTILETTLPAIAVAFISSPSIDLVYRPLANPAVFGFFLFISLSTLRLDPELCWLSGLTAAVSYLAAAAYLGWRPSMSGEASLISPESSSRTFMELFLRSLTAQSNRTI